VPAVVIWGLGTTLTCTYLWYDYQQNKPRIGQPAVGRVYPEYMRGVTVYLTQAEQTLLNACFAASLTFALAGFLIFGVIQRQQERVNEQRYTRDASGKSQ